MIFKSVLMLLLLQLIPVETDAQDSAFNKYGLYIIRSVEMLEKSVTGKPGKKMVDIRKSLPGVSLDLKYTGSDHFLHTALYPPLQTTYLRQAAATALQAAREALKAQGLDLRIWDAYRPYSVTERMWETVKDDRYAADPRTGSGHNRGIAVDLTLIYLATNRELDMGTGFDHFTDTAHHNFAGLPQQVLLNRLQLRAIMERYGFKSLETEWWHYYLPDATTYELLDLGFTELDKAR